MGMLFLREVYAFFSELSKSGEKYRKTKNLVVVDALQQRAELKSLTNSDLEMEFNFRLVLIIELK